MAERLGDVCYVARASALYHDVDHNDTVRLVIILTKNGIDSSSEEEMI